MSANPIDENSTPKTTGSLEDLFRHHLGEEAAVPPRPMLWDQIDNSLLIRQNEVYRRRLAATRWVAAASLLLATLAGTGWWARRDLGAGAEVATTTAQPAGRSTAPSATAANGGSGRFSGASGQPNAATPAATTATGADAYATRNSEGQTYIAEGGTGLGTQSVRRGLESQVAASTRPSAPRTYTPSSELAGRSAPGIVPQGAAASGTTIAAHTAQPAASGTAGAAGASTAAEAGTSIAPNTGMLVASVPAVGSSAELGAASSIGAIAAAPAGPDAVGLLAARPAALGLAQPSALPSGLAAVDSPDPILQPKMDKWHYGATYTAGIFNPNVNFSRRGIEHEFDYNPALGPDSPALTEAAAAQYREHLRPGLSQRIALLASRRLSGRWSLSTGAEFAQATAKSASTTAFVGEQLYDLGPYTHGPLRTTNFRYRTASIPVEVRYGNPVKRGWSLYGRLGGVVSALLGVRSEVEGDPEATKTYSLISAGTPYRRVLGSVRGAAGAQFRPNVGNWALSLGPVAELGLTPLNAHPAQSYLAQSRPYSFGMEAGVEFGK